MKKTYKRFQLALLLLSITGLCSCSRDGSQLNCELCQPAVGEFSATEICETGPNMAEYRIDGELRGEPFSLEGRSLEQYIEEFCTGN